jgi:hypothetical protein
VNTDHYAIVIGLSSYPRLGDPPPADLHGPENDAHAIFKWLTNPTEGGLPEANVKCILSTTSGSPPDAKPTRGDLDATFLWLDQLADANQAAGRRRRVGTRLYLYASGHGFSPRFRQGCLLAADAAQRQFSANVFPSAWIDWLQDAEYFREFVLWMDCCMDRQVLTQPSPPPLDPIGGNNALPGPSFIAFAATRPLKAIEKQIPEDAGKFHGIFTWNLLQGLRGAAANPFGVVTGRSLADWVLQAQFAWLDDSERANPDVAKEPAIVDQDDRLIFSRGLQPFEFDVTLRINAATGDQTARLWSGFPPQAGAPFTIAQNGTTLRLKPGLYLAEVQASGLRHGFSVSKSGDIVLNELGNAPQVTAGMFALTVSPGDPTSDIRLVGDAFRPIDAGAGHLASKLPYGLYQMRIRVGRQIAEKVILLDADWPTLIASVAAPPATPDISAGGGNLSSAPAAPVPAAPSVVAAQAAPTIAAAGTLPQLPLITSAAPLPLTRTTHEYHEEAVAAGRQRIDLTIGSGAELMIMARCFSAIGLAGANAQPWGRVELLDWSGNLVADLAVQGQRSSGPGDPYALCTLAVTPGTYVLRHGQGQTEQTGSLSISQVLIVPKGGWRLEAYLLKRLDSPEQASSGPLRMSLLMRRIGMPAGGSADDILLEKSRVALADERPVLSEELTQLLGSKFDNPLAGIIGGHLLLIDHDLTGRSLDLINIVVDNLRTLVGSEYPDVEALSLVCPDPTRRTKIPLSAPPMYERSWRMMAAASQNAPELVPLALWERVHAMIAAPPFLMWLSDPQTMQQYRGALVDALFGERRKASRSSPLPSVGGVAPTAASPSVLAPANIPGLPVNSATSVATSVMSMVRSAGLIFKQATRRAPTQVRAPAALPENEALRELIAVRDQQRVAGLATDFDLPRSALDALKNEYLATK